MGSSVVMKAAEAVNVRFLSPPCVGCSEGTVTALPDLEAAEEMLSLSWTQTELEDVLSRETADVVVMVSCPPLSAPFLSQKGTTQFITMQSTQETGTHEISYTANNYLTVPLRSESAAYVNGVLSAMQTARMNSEMAVLTTAAGSSSPEVRAFYQGAFDANPDVCVFTKVVAMNTSDLYSTQFDAVLYTADQAVQNGADVIYSTLGLLDTAVMAAVKNKSSADYAISAVTGFLTAGDFNKTGTLGKGWLSQNSVDMERLLRWVLAAGSPFRTFVTARPTVAELEGYLGAPEGVANGGDYSYSMWTESVANGAVSSAAWADMHEPCAANSSATQLSVVQTVSTEVRSAGVANISSDPSTFPTTCPHAALFSTPFLEAVRTSVESCSKVVRGVRLVGVGIYMNNLGDVNLKTGSFYVDYNLYLHQSKTLYRSVNEARAAMKVSASCQHGQLCGCTFGQNEWENYAAGDDFDEIVNLVNVDRVRTITPVLKKGLDGESLIEYFRVQAPHLFTPELKTWPMDTQLLEVKLEDYGESNTDNQTVQFCHLEHFTGLAPNARFFPGMELEVGKRPWTAAVTSTCWPYLEYPTDYADGVCKSEDIDGKELRVNPSPTRYNTENMDGGSPSCFCLGGTKASSRYTFGLSFTSPPVPTFMKTFLPPIFIVFVNQGVWFMYPKSFETRLGVCGSGLISAVMYHVSLASNTPVTSVLTSADRFMLGVYYNNLLSFMFVFAQTILYQADLRRLSWKSFRFTRVWGPLVCIVSLFIIGLNEDIGDAALVTLATTAGLAVVVNFIVLKLLDSISQKYMGAWHGFNTKAEASRLSSLSSPSELKNMTGSDSAFGGGIQSGPDYGEPHLGELAQHLVVE